VQALTAVTELINRWWAYVEFCLEAALTAPVCRPFWTWSVIALLGLGAVTCVAIAWRYLSWRHQHKVAQRAYEQRMSVADEATMQAARWNADKAYQSDVPPEEIERRIREAVEQRRREAGGEPRG